LAGTLPANNFLLAGTVRPIIPYWTEPFRPRIPYWPELFRSIIPYWPELFRSIIPYWPKVLLPIPANKFVMAQQNWARPFLLCLMCNQLGNCFLLGSDQIELLVLVLPIIIVFPIVCCSHCSHCSHCSRCSCLHCR
jgi:hypothetical protein